MNEKLGYDIIHMILTCDELDVDTLDNAVKNLNYFYRSIREHLLIEEEIKRMKEEKV